MSKALLRQLGTRIRKRRKELGWTQEELALKAGIDRSYVGGVERGERNITFLTLCRLCKVMKCDLGTLGAGIPSTISH